MSDAAALARGAVVRLGRHPAALAGLDLSVAGDRARWLVLARLLSERAREEVALTAYARLAADPGTDPDALAAAGPARVAAALAGAGVAKPEALAPVLCRAAIALCERHRGDLDALAAQCDGLEQLGGALAALAPGLGTASVLRFLRPLRDAWSAARETPLAEPTRAAAIHVGLLTESEDLEGEPAAFRAACARAVPELAPVDVEAALERLGSASCRQVSRSEPEASEDQRRGRIARCPLGADCPKSAS
jgi:hypothetical protein